MRFSGSGEPAGAPAASTTRPCNSPSPRLADQLAASSIAALRKNAEGNTTSLRSSGMPARGRWGCGALSLCDSAVIAVQVVSSAAACGAELAAFLTIDGNETCAGRSCRLGP